MAIGDTDVIVYFTSTIAHHRINRMQQYPSGIPHGMRLCGLQRALRHRKGFPTVQMKGKPQLVPKLL